MKIDTVRLGNVSHLLQRVDVTGFGGSSDPDHGKDQQPILLALLQFAIQVGGIQHTIRGKVHMHDIAHPQPKHGG